MMTACIIIVLEHLLSLKQFIMGNIIVEFGIKMLDLDGLVHDSMHQYLVPYMEEVIQFSRPPFVFFPASATNRRP